ncbi:nucleotide sugar dehydrogenase [Vibrio splendidus]|uniref:nucleotide sugar dehydrogenase n=1 Tax=Vibrio splendidus TaxID=29497 RepID=UPI000E329811|nr:nucleotide sugar dehydrogenase [Vibrio splendidus]
MNKKYKIAVIGLGYVGLPLAVELGKKYATVGFDINNERISELMKGIDSTLECDKAEMLEASFLKYSNNVDDIRQCNIYIVTVPTPINKHKQPDLSPLINASKMLGQVLAKNDIVIYESTVYPGATEEQCVPALESVSGLRFNEDFFVGYSPERINPGDKINRLINIKKVTSGSTPKTASLVDELYSSIVKAGTHKASSIKVAEASKIIENTQRDVNIALMNEFSIIFDKLDVNTNEVIDAAATKWNFINLKPGLVGGHCIGVDPYYLVHKAQEVGFIPDIMKASREINDGMASYVANKFIKKVISHDLKVKGLRVLTLGLTFKPNCPDIRNTKVVDFIEEVRSYGVNIDIHDPEADLSEVKAEYGIDLIGLSDESQYDVVITAVKHDAFDGQLYELVRSKSKFNFDLF